MEIDDLLAMVENPTRRRILEMLADTPSYALRLSKELGISQQAVMKNLALMERNGMVTCYRESSSMGPDRTVYAPNAEFTLVVDMHGSVFSVRLMPEPGEPSGAEEALARLEEIGKELDELERRKADLRREAEDLREMLGMTAGAGIPRKESEERSIWQKTKRSKSQSSSPGRPGEGSQGSTLP